ncbi:uncharacterized protein BCR38DRAFT_442876 [Pseudomassariella vexata]|uniref:F-box domain-containing protein n=1 Tax=Pseudomassariella vexata TaxID=1141098 RepID=A0A1Y2DNP6_9PEZI|nr:uncharacterized protein BCR38DRAFT_442876 [Pseudomassariella vexata]ORY60908.1 hypothetical protein BCR38DRAFT_442876 [Pseudomassariella vexata]
MAPFDALPDELIHHILQYIPPAETLLKISCLSRRLNRVAETPLLWRYYCETSFKYWQSDHAFKDKLRTRASGVDWKRLFTIRLHRNHRVAELLDEIVASRLARLQRTEEICQFGYDAKDYLLTQCRTSDDAEDVLARRYYSCTVLDSIHRSLAIAEWAKFQKHAAYYTDMKTPNSEKLKCGMRLERALGAFDMFMLHDNEGDMDEITEMLDALADHFRQAHPNIEGMTTREKAVTLARWLHENDMTGLDDPEETYRYLRNCLIGRALKDDRHPSLPIISCAIYSVLAERIGVEAYCCALPNQVHAIVLSPTGISLDGQRLSDGDLQQKMFLDPFATGDEVSKDYLHMFLYRCGVTTGHDNLLTPTATDLIVTRTAQNIRSSFTSFRARTRPVSELIPMIELSRGDWARNLQPALYSMIWASIMMVPIMPDNEDVRWDWQQDARDLLTYFYEYFPEDSWLIEKYICPMYDTFAAPGRRQNIWELPSKRVRDQIKEIRRLDLSEKPPRRRTVLTGSLKPKYRVGQVFKHRRYDYYGLILGWTVDGVQSMGWDDGSHLRHLQPYYRCMLGTDGSDHHIYAEENLEVVDVKGGVEVLPTEIRDLLPMAGKFFKRWDAEAGVFVSNLREMFPED